MADEAEGGPRAERWDARLGSLETRLEMLETAIKSEVDRVKLSADDIGALVDEFRSTIGDTRNLADLANDIGDRLTLLHSLEATVSGAASAVADEVKERLGETAPLLHRTAGQLGELSTRLEQLGPRF
ncbi:MAG: hypothetical protein QOE63_324, partial [Acidimicrobiaceae bacterium]